MVIQVLIIHGQLAFAIALKQGLERSNQFEAHPFRSVDAAFDYLRDHVQDVAVVDFTLGEMTGDELVTRLRDIQPTISVIATPYQPDRVVNELQLQGSLDTKFSARELGPLLRELFREYTTPTEMQQKLPPTKKHAPLTAEPEPPPPPELPEVSKLDSILSSMGEVYAQDAYDDLSPSLDEGSEDSSSVWDVPVRQTDLFGEVLNALPAQDTPKPRKDDPFSDLVNSMKGDKPHEPLPSRKSDYVEFVFKGGLETLFEQMDRVAENTQKTGLFKKAEESGALNQKLAQEEPPPPDFEDNGTVGDLAASVGEQSFREVLSILRDEPVPAPKPEELKSMIAPVPETDFIFDDVEQGESFPAKAILSEVFAQTRSEGFSLEDLLTNIERQLPRQRPRVQPLPSWVRESQQRAESEKFLTNEPDFLPDSLPEMVDEADSRFVDDLTIPSKALHLDQVPDETQWLPEPIDEALPVPEEQWDTPEPVPAEALDFSFDESEPEAVDEPVAADEPVGVDEQWELPLEPEAAAPVDEEQWSLPSSETDLWERVMSLDDSAPVVEIPELPEMADLVLPFPADELVLADEVVPPPEEVIEPPVLPFPPEDLALPEDVEDTAGYTKPFARGTVPTASPLIAFMPPPPDELPEFPALTAENFNTSFELLAAFEVVEEKPLDDERYDFTLGRVPALMTPAADDPRVAQLALNLTDASLELTAEATLLTRHGEIVAFAGRMPEDEVMDIRPFIPIDGSSIPSGSNIRFVSAKDSPKNYMLYSAVTDDDLILSLVFASTTPLRDIRKQGQRLAQALHSVPELPAPPIEVPVLIPEPADTGVRSTYAFVWIVENTSVTLTPPVAGAITAGMQMQLRERGWIINRLHVDEDYIYLLADIPGETMPYELVRDLKRRAASIACAQNPNFDPDLLWSDGYLVVAPGRALEVDEIQEFISFERMA
ncbi:MAG: transposase [Chloroflexi bacterium]|nr:transposase [Chloroflexota bacterium]